MLCIVPHSMLWLLQVCKRLRLNGLSIGHGLLHWLLCHLGLLLGLLVCLGFLKVWKLGVICHEQAGLVWLITDRVHEDKVTFTVGIGIVILTGGCCDGYFCIRRLCLAIASSSLLFLYFFLILCPGLLTCFFLSLGSLSRLLLLWLLIYLGLFLELLLCLGFVN